MKVVDQIMDSLRRIEAKLDAQGRLALESATVRLVEDEPETQYGGRRFAGIDGFYFIIEGDNSQRRWNGAQQMHVMQAHLGFGVGKPFFIPYFHFDPSTLHHGAGIPKVSERIEDHAVLFRPRESEPIPDAAELARLARLFADRNHG